VSTRFRTSAGALLAALTLSAPATARAPALAAVLTCDPITGPGRVLCSVEVRGLRTARMAWADALVVAAPEFARPLRSRVAAPRLEPSSKSARIALALVATGEGRGTLRVRARAVLCQPRAGGELCWSEVQEPSVELAFPSD